MRRWFLWIAEFIIGAVLMAASFQWFPFPFNIIITLGISVVTALFLAPRLAPWLADCLIDFIYSSKGASLGDDYDFKRVDAEYQRLWSIIKTIWYLLLYAGIIGLAWAANGLHSYPQGEAWTNLQYWQLAVLFVGGVLWSHFIFFHFLGQLEESHQRWLAGVHDEEEVKMEPTAKWVETDLDSDTRPRPPRRDPFYKGEPAE